MEIVVKKLEAKFPTIKSTDDSNKYLSHISEAEALEEALIAEQEQIQIEAPALSPWDQLIEEHKSELLQKRRQYIEDKGYGVIDKSKWESEKVYFINTVLRAHTKTKHSVRHFSDDTLKYMIENRLNKLASKSTEAPPLGKPIEFEHYCAGELERTGWRVSTTKASGDQGADVIAKKGKVKIVLQCKQYSKPVGNAAVQEAHSAKSHYSADFAAVVTNKSYTKSAKELAISTGVLLLHQDELADLDSLL